jgi:chemotaxis protein methyltransferase CheR
LLKHYDEFRIYLEDVCGIVLGDNKQYLVSSRIGRIMAEKGFDDLAQLVSQLKRDPRSQLARLIIDAMTTNETLWFRDAHPYNILKDRLLPELQSAGGGPLKVWSAACSSGQEPYSISMTVDEYKRANLGRLKRSVDVLATDLSQGVLEAAKSGCYDALALGRGLSDERRRQYFDEKGDNLWEVKSTIKQGVRFQSMNLLDSYAMLGKFDIVFCRNVLIYFSPEVKADILRRIHGVLKPGGYLFLGGSEAISGAAEHFEMVQCRPGIVYRAR